MSVAARSALNSTSLCRCTHTYKEMYTYKDAYKCTYKDAHNNVCCCQICLELHQSTACIYAHI